MANVKIPELPELAEAPAADDKFVVNDTSATETKWVSMANVAAGAIAGVGGLQGVYEGGNTIDVTTAEGTVTIANSADVTDLLTLSRTFAGAGDGIDVTLGASATGVGVRVTTPVGGDALSITDAVDTLVVRAAALRASGALALLTGGTARLTVGASGGVTVANGALTVPDADGGNPGLRIASGAGTGIKGIDADTVDLIASGQQVARVTAPSGANPRFRVTGGTVALPGLSPLNDTNTGLFWNGDDYTRVSYGATEALALGPSVNVQLANNGIVSGAVGYLLVAGFVAGTATEAVRLTNGSTFTGGAAVAQVGTAIRNTINQTSTALFTDLLINRTQTAAGSGTQRLIDAQVGGASMFSVSNAGVAKAKELQSEQFILKGASEAIANNTLQDDDSLTVDLLAAGVYKFRFFLFVLTAGASGGIKCAVGGTAGVTTLRARIAINDDAAPLAAGFAGQVTAFDATVGGVLVTGDHSVEIEGTIVVSTAGTFKLRWAQEVTDAGNPTTVRSSSSLIVQRCN